MKERAHKPSADGRTSDVLEEIRASMDDMQKVLGDIVSQQRTILKRFVASERKALRSAAKSVTPHKPGRTRPATKAGPKSSS